jgi:hypothetical protein
MLIIAVLVGVALSEAVRRFAPLSLPKGNHRAPRPGAWDLISGSLLLVRAKGVYADLVGSSDPAQQEQAPHHTTSA